MMMEQQVVLKNSNDDEMQEKWKSCIHMTCYAYRMAERVKEVIDNLYDAMRTFLNSLAEAFKPVMQSLTLVWEEFRDFVDKHEDFIEYMSDYQHSYPPYVDNLKINTRGFPRPISHCARSRC